MEVAAELAELVGEHRVSTHPADLHRHAIDWSASALVAKRSDASYRLPSCVVRPRTVEQVSSILAWAERTRTPVVPYGGGSAVVGSIASGGAVVIELRAMNEILDFDEKSRLVRAQAGVSGPDLRETLADWGYMLGHEPQSIEISTLGGWIATRATGQLSARYGGIERMVAGLEAVLPGGRVVRSLVAPRSATGPDVASLMIGSEGTLGVVTEAALRVVPLVVERADACLRFEHMSDGVAACRALAQSDLDPTVVRLYDREDTAIFMRDQPNDPMDPMLLLSFDGAGARQRCERAVELTGGSDGDEAIVAQWWDERNDAVAAYRDLMAGRGILGPHAIVDTIEVAGTWNVLRDLYHSMKEALTPLADVCGCHISHIYPDGACLYFTLASAPPTDEAALEMLESWWEAAMTTCGAAGGSISHHHGVGRRKAPWLPRELDGWWHVLVAVKRAIDPHGIMNPGALGL
jgi:alkyldihydroxyacetonephosphate synthase